MMASVVIGEGWLICEKPLGASECRGELLDVLGEASVAGTEPRCELEGLARSLEVDEGIWMEGTVRD
jgi:hypothetical protein